MRVEAFKLERPLTTLPARVFPAHVWRAELPIDAELLRVGIEGAKPVIRAVVKGAAAKRTRRFLVVGTGEEFGSVQIIEYGYLGTLFNETGVPPSEGESSFSFYKAPLHVFDLGWEDP